MCGQSESTAGQWTTGLCGCFEDFSSCCTTIWCPIITFGRNVEMIDKGKTSCESAAQAYLFWLVCLHCCPYVYSCTYRNKLRGLFQLPEQPCKDCCVHLCCMCCALCQEYRELKNRGLDPSKGWCAYEERMNGVGTTAPHVMQTMTR